MRNQELFQRGKTVYINQLVRCTVNGHLDTEAVDRDIENMEGEDLEAVLYFIMELIAHPKEFETFIHVQTQFERLTPTGPVN